MSKMLDENYKVISSRIFGLEEIVCNEKLSILEDIDQSYIVYNQEELIATIKYKNEIVGIDCNKVQTIIIMGVSGLKYLEEELITLPIETQILIIEPNKELLLLELSKFDYKRLFARDIIIYCDMLEKLNMFINEYFTNMRILKIGNLITYINDVYRYDEEISQYIKEIRRSLAHKIYSMGNCIEDSLIGIRQNMENLKWLKESKSVSNLKDKFKGIPAIIVSAGPSINKNINLLKEVQDNYIIIAVDTIVPRLLQEGIMPHFICSVERIEKVYTYFYKDKNYPKEITLVGPALLRPEIFEEFKGEKIIPLRKGVEEYKWLSQILDFTEEDFSFMGISCAHMAMGIGEHFGCEPIVLIGQDLAFAEDGKQTHASGTIYDDEKVSINAEEKIYEVQGYYGDLVKTNEIWLAFKDWFEKYIYDMQTTVINATEGGAKIDYTQQLSLNEVIARYPGHKKNVYEIIKQSPKCTIDIERVVEKLKVERDSIEELTKSVEQQVKILTGIKIDKKSKINLEKIREKLFETDKILSKVGDNELLLHLYQSHIVTSVWKYYKLDLSVNEFTIRENIKIQIELLEPIIVANKQVIEAINNGINNLITKIDSKIS